MIVDPIPLLRSRLADLQRKRQARINQPGFAENVKAIDAQIAEIEAALADV